MSALPEVILIDAGTGNLRSVQKALEKAGARVAVTRSPQGLPSGAPVVLPGVGAFGAFMEGLRRTGLDEALAEAVRSGSPLLGICVGMQALFEVSEEMGEHHGLGLLPGRVVRFSTEPGRKVPHTGWNALCPQRPSGLLAGLSTQSYAYFNHSFYCAPDLESDVATRTDYGVNFASVVQRDRVCGVQFHPEKSQSVGLRILANFVKEFADAEKRNE